VLRVARERFDPAGMTFVLVGNPLLFGQRLESLHSLVHPLDIAIPEPKPRSTQASEASLALGKQILARAQQAAGGAQQLAAVTDYTQVAEFLLTPENGGMKVVQTERWIAPATFRQDSVLPAGSISAYLDGRNGWVATPNGSGVLAGWQLQQVEGDLFRSYFRLLLSDRLPERTVGAVEGDPTAAEIGDAAGHTATVEFDPGTGLPRRVSYDGAQATGVPIPAADEYADFREVAGVKVPFKITLLRGGRKFADAVVTEFKINSNLQARELAKRP